jgi:hypothetical protein
MGITGSTVSAWCRTSGRKLPAIPDGATLRRLADELRWSPTYILTGMGPETLDVSTPRTTVLSDFLRLVARAISVQVDTTPEFAEAALGSPGVGANLEAPVKGTPEDVCDGERLVHDSAEKWRPKVERLLRIQRLRERKMRGADTEGDKLRTATMLDVMRRWTDAENRTMSALPPSRSGEQPMPLAAMPSSDIIARISGLIPVGLLKLPTALEPSIDSQVISTNPEHEQVSPLRAPEGH